MPPSCQRHSTYEAHCRECSSAPQGNHPQSNQRASRHQVMHHNGPSNSGGVRRLDLDESYPSPSGGFFSPAPSSPNKKQKMDDRYEGSSSMLSSPNPHSAFITPEPAGSTVSAFSTSSSATTSTSKGEGWAQQGRRNSDPLGGRGDRDFYPLIQAAYNTVTGNTQNQNQSPNQASSSKVHKHMSTGSPLTTPTQQTMRPSTPRRQSQNRLSIGLVAKLPSDKRESLTSSRNPPPSPSPSAHTHSNRASRVMQPLTAIPSPQTVFELKITDYGYRVGDRRREFVKMIDLEHMPEPPSPAPGGFLPPLEKDEIARLNAQFEKGYEDSEEFHDALSFQDPSEPEPGYYVALYDFKAEDPAEMDLVAGSTVQCLGRGGGEGWMVAVREGSGGKEVAHALVPESYLEFQKAFSAGERDRAMAQFAP